MENKDSSKIRTMTASEWSALSTVRQIEAVKEKPVVVTWHKLHRLFVQHLDGEPYEVHPPGTGERLAGLERQLAESNDETDA